MGILIYKHALGEALRQERMAQGRSLRSVSELGWVSLGHLSDVERGTKDLSSDLLECVAKSLGVPTYELVIRAGMLMAGVEVPDTIESLLDNYTEMV